MSPRVSRAVRRAHQDYARARQPWRNETTAAVRDQVAKSLVDIKPLGRGPAGVDGGRVYHRLSLPAHEETTRQLAGLYPLLAGRGLPPIGAYVGKDRFSRGAFHFDPFALYMLQFLTNPNMAVFGTIGSGKSTLIKALLLRWNAFNVKFLVPADVKGEYRLLADAVGATRVALGGGFALSPLYAPDKPAHWDEILYRQRIEQHRLLLLRSLGETALCRPLTPIENTMIELALTKVTCSDTGTSTGRLRQPTLPEFTDVLLRPTPAMAAAVPMDFRTLSEGSLDLALTFRSMLVGALKGVFDGEAVPLNLSRPGLVIDISRIRASDAAIALAMTCGQALADLVLTFSRDLWVKSYDECWKQIAYPAIVRRISEGQKLTRGDDTTTGSATILSFHRISDLLGGSSEVRELAKGLLADTATRIVYNQASDQLPLTSEALGFNDVQTAHIGGLPRGTGMWQIGNQSALVDHIVLTGGLEQRLTNTDSRMVADGGDHEFETPPDNAAMRAEIGL